jgi:hypothetical protein
MTIVAAFPACAALKMTKVSQVTRPSGYNFTYGAQQISGVTYAGDNLFYAIDDTDNKLYPLVLAINRSDGSLAEAGISIGAGVIMSGGNDMEGCAFDPCSGGVWISQETSALIREFDPATGTLSRSAPVPAVQRQCVGNYSLEALTISGDGRTMWTCNEESLKCDGTNSTLTAGTTVRLTKFSRTSVYDNWTLAGQWAYLTRPIGESSGMYLVSNARSGVSALTALPDGTLLVLERGYGGWGSLADDFKNYIYAVDFSGATDVTNIKSLKDADYTLVGKVEVFKNITFKVVNYEGMCLGPQLSDGSVALVVIADGGSGGNEKVMTLKLSGLGIVRTVNFARPQVGTSSIAGGPYRFMDGASVSLSIDGAEYASAYTNNAASCTNVAWSLSGVTGALIDWGSGVSASFTVTEDATFHWGMKSAVASTPIDFADSFEGYAVGSHTAAGEVEGWTGEAEVAAMEYAPPNPPGFPMPKDAHTKVLDVDDFAERSFSCTTNGNDRLDMMIAVVRRSNDEPPVEVKEGEKVVIVCDTDGMLKLRCRDACGEIVWATLSDTVYANGEWVRLSVSLDSTTKPGETYALVRINGEACFTDFGVRSPLDPTPGGAWHRTLEVCDGGRICALGLHGAVKIDDVIKTTEDFDAEISAETTHIDGVPVAWLRSAGLGLNPEAPMTGENLRNLGYLLGDMFDIGLDPAVDEPFAITGVRILDDGRLELAFNGVREDLGEAARDELYPVYRMETIGGDESPVGGTTEIVELDGVKRTVWTSDEPVDETHGFYRVEVDSRR